MDFHVSNVETEDELKQHAREYILQRVCDKYRLQGDSEFDPEEMEKALHAFDKKFLRSNIRDILNGWDLIEFTEEGFTLKLNKSGVKWCQEQDKGI
jgi:ferredoxin-fold anticodon binding domain-containing protein